MSNSPALLTSSIAHASSTFEIVAVGTGMLWLQRGWRIAHAVTIVLWLINFFLLSTPSSAASFRGIGFPSNYYGSRATDISADGDTIVGVTYPGSFYRATKWNTATLASTELDRRGDWSRANSVSGDGSVIVGSTNARLHAAAAWLASDPIQLLPIDGYPSFAWDVSSSGSIVVGQTHLASNLTVPYIHDRESGATNYVVTSPYGYGSAYAVSGDGKIVVGNIDRDAFRWTQESGLELILGSEECDFMRPTAIAGNGRVVGGYCHEESATAQAYVWTDQGVQLLGQLAEEGHNYWPLALSFDGSVALGAVDFGESRREAFFWTSEDGIRRAFEVFSDDFGLANQMTGWRLTEASGMSADGRTLVGTGINPQGIEEGWVVRLDNLSATTGDTDADGDVDLIDLNNVRNNFGTSGNPALGDTWPFDGSVDLIDLNAVRNNFGVGNAHVVPEPDTALLSLMAISVFAVATAYRIGCVYIKQRGAALTTFRMPHGRRITMPAQIVSFVAAHAALICCAWGDQWSIRPVADLNPGAKSSSPAGFSQFEEMLLFGAAPTGGRLSLYRLREEQVLQIYAEDPQLGDVDIRTEWFSTFQDEALFVGVTATEGAELYATDGSFFRRIQDPYPGRMGNSPGRPLVFGDLAVFDALNGASASSRSLFKSDGQIVELIPHVDPTAEGIDPSSLVRFKNRLYFSAKGSSTGRELYVTDGESVSLVSDLDLGARESSPEDITVYHDALYFSATTDPRFSGSGRELFRTDGTTTTLFADINPNGLDSNPSHLRVFNDKLFFNARGPEGRELFMTDGLSVSVVDDPDPSAFDSGLVDGYTAYAEFQGNLFFLASGPLGIQLFRTDGSTVLPVPGMNGLEYYFSFGLEPAFLEVGDRLYFRAETSDTGIELFSTDGNEVTLVADLVPGFGDSVATPLFEDDGHLILWAFGVETATSHFYSVDGQSVTLIDDINPAAHDSTQGNIPVEFNGRYIYTGFGPNGWELYELSKWAAGISGDTNQDGRVDLVDLNNVRNNFGGTGLGDTNGDGTINLVDLNAVRNNFGVDGIASSNVPEASGAVMAFLGLSVAVLFRGLEPIFRSNGNRRRCISAGDATTVE